MMTTLAITHYNRFEMVIESFKNVIDDVRLSEILILDDCSTDGSYEKLISYFSDNKKVKIIRQVENRGMSMNKRDAISYASNEWVIILDSDNIISSDYLNAFYNQIKKDGYLHKGCIYMPDFAKPEFNFKKYAGRTYSAILLPPVHEPMGNVMMNCCNYVVNKNDYLSVYNHNSDHKCSDTIWFNYLWLKAGNIFYVVPVMEYKHLVHNGSAFMQDVNYNMRQSEKVRKMIMAL